MTEENDDPLLELLVEESSPYLRILKEEEDKENKIKTRSFLGVKLRRRRSFVEKERGEKDGERKKGESIIQHAPKVFKFGYSVNLLSPKEDGLIESFVGDFLSENNTNSTKEDNFNFGLDEEKFVQILNHSIFMHYEKLLCIKVEEKRIKEQEKMSVANMMNNVNSNNPMLRVMPAIGIAPYSFGNGIIVNGYGKYPMTNMTNLYQNNA